MGIIQDAGAEMRCVVKCRVLLPSHIPTPRNNPHRVAFGNNYILKGLSEWESQGLSKERFFGLIKAGLITPCTMETVADVVQQTAVKPPVAIGAGSDPQAAEGSDRDAQGIPMTGNDPNRKDGFGEAWLRTKETDELRRLVLKQFPETGQKAIDKMSRSQLENTLSGTDA